MRGFESVKQNRTERGVSGVRIFDKRQRAIVAWEKALIERLSEFLAGFGASPSDAEIVRKALREIEEPLQILVAGDDGPVRPAFVNALIGAGTHEEAEREANQIAVLRHAGKRASASWRMAFSKSLARRSFCARSP